MASTAMRRPAVGYEEGDLACLPWRDVAGDVRAWDALARRAAEPNPFLESWYLLPSLEHFDGNGEPAVLCFMRDGILSGLMPVARPSHYAGWPLGHISNWLHPNMFLGSPLVAQGAEAAFWRAVLEWADSNAGTALFLHLSTMPLDGPLQAALESVLEDDGRAWGIVQRHERATLASTLTPADYLARSLPGRQRKDLDRRMKRLRELGEVEFRWETGPEGVERWTEEFLAVEASGWKGERNSALACDTATAAVFRQALRGAAARERLVRLSLRLDGQPIALLSTFLAPPGAFGFKTAFDEAFSRYSPGILLEREYLDVLQRFGIRWCDSCAAADHSVMNRIWGERRAIGRVSIALGGPVRRALFTRLLRKEMAGSPSEDYR